MDPNRTGDAARVRGAGGADTGPLPQPGASDAGQPTTYIVHEIPPEIRPIEPPAGYGYAGYGGTYAGAPPAPPTPPPASAVPYAYPQRVRRPHRSPVLGPLLLIGAGVVFLLNNVGVLPWSVWETLGRLWPLILIAIGLDLVLGRRSPALSLVVVLALVAIAVTTIYYGGLPGGKMQSSSLNVPLNGATAATVRIHSGVGSLNVDSAGETSALATGTLEYYDNSTAPSQDVSRDGQTVTLDLSQEGRGFNFSMFGENHAPHWNISLNRNVPLDLQVSQGTGSLTLDLEKLQVKSLNVEGGVGNTSVTMPAGGQVSASIKGGTGNIEVIVPKGAKARFSVDNGLGHVTADSTFTHTGNTYTTSSYTSTAPDRLDITINHGVGNVDIRSK
jgi:LiaI-LiaF-like transmembrane region/N-terminal domain of toast_rack, DUF2154